MLAGLVLMRAEASVGLLELGLPIEVCVAHESRLSGVQVSFRQSRLYRSCAIANGREQTVGISG